MSKTFFFTVSDYWGRGRVVLSLVRSRPGVALAAAGLACLLWAWTLAAPLWGAPRPWQGPWGSAVVVAATLVLFGVFGALGLMLRRGLGDGAPVTGRAWLNLVSDWGSLTLRIALQGAVVMAPAWVPSAAVGFWDGFNSATSGQAALDVPWLGPWVALSSSVLSSVLGFFYLWSYPALVFYTHVQWPAFHRWCRRLAYRTWPLALGFGLVSLAALLWPAESRARDLWNTLHLTLQIGFVTAQAYLLAEGSRRPGFGP